MVKVNTVAKTLLMMLRHCQRPLKRVQGSDEKRRHTALALRLRVQNQGRAGGIKAPLHEDKHHDEQKGRNIVGSCFASNLLGHKKGRLAVLYLMLRTEEVVDGLDRIEGGKGHFYKYCVPVAHRTIPQTW